MSFSKEFDYATVVDTRTGEVLGGEKTQITIRRDRLVEVIYPLGHSTEIPLRYAVLQSGNRQTYQIEPDPHLTLIERVLRRLHI